MIGLLFRAIRRIVIDLSVLTIFFLLAPGLPPYNATFSSYSVTPALPLTGALKPNGELDSAERLFEGKFAGPESIAWKTHDEIFLSIHGGTIIKVFGKRFDRIARVTRIGPSCAGPWQEKICGRPLGLRFAPDGNLLVADAYYGIYSVNVDTGEKECLVSADQEIDGKPFKIANDLDVDSDGNIYWSDSSFNADLSDGTLVIAEDPTGRLMKYDPATGSNEVLLKDVHFANGVQLSSNQDFIVLAETPRYRIHRYWLKGDMAGRSDIFLDGLPGMPDNIRPRPDGGFYVSLIKPRLAEANDPFMYIMENVPVFRKLVARVLSVAQWIIDSINNVYPHELLEKASYNVLNLGPLEAVFKSNISIVVEVDEEGNILGSLQGSTGNIQHISETAHIGDNIFFGSPYNKYLGRLYVGPAPSSVEEEPSMEEPLFEAIGEGITMNRYKKSVKEVGTDETEKSRDEKVKELESANIEKVGEAQDLGKNTEQEDTQGSEQLEQIKDQTVQEQKESDQNASIEEQKTEIEQQDVETAEAEGTEAEKPVDLTLEEFTHAKEEKAEAENNAQEMPVIEVEEDFTQVVEEVITKAVEEGVDIDDSVKEKPKIAGDTVQEEGGLVDSEVTEEGTVDVESTADVVKEEPTITVDTVQEEVGPVDSEVTEEGTVDVETPADVSQFVQDTEDIETDVPHQGEEHMTEAATQNVADSVSQVEEVIPDKEAAPQIVEDDVAQVEDVIPDKDPLQIEEPVVVEESQQKSEQKEEIKEVNQAPQVQENKDEL